MHEVTVRYWAGAKAAAGRESETFPAADLAQLQELAQRAHPELRAVFAVASFLLDGRRISGAEPLRSGSVVEVLPPFAGG